MAAETILVIDAGQDLDERMTTALEAEDYLCYCVSSQDVNAQLADLLKPSLIYIRPADLRPTGLSPCKTIHAIPLLMKVPLVILASLKKPPGPTYLEEYGIVDFLELTFSSEQLIEKTAAILGKNSSRNLEKMPASTLEKTASSTSDFEETLLFAQPVVDEPTESPPVRNVEKKRPAVVLPAVALMAVLGIAAAAYIAYRHFMPGQKGPTVTIKTPARVATAAPQTEVKPQLPPASTEVAKIPANAATDRPGTSTIPAPSAPPTPPVQPASVPSENLSPPPAKPFYSVQLGAFRDEQTAVALTKKFKDKGYDAFTQPGVTKDSSPVYRVLVNKYENRKAAQRMAGEIQTKEQVKTALYGE